MKRVRQCCFGASADFFWDHLTVFLSVVSSVRILPSRLFGRSEFGAGRGPAAFGRYRLGRSQKCVGADKGCLPGKRKPALRMQGRLSKKVRATDAMRPFFRDNACISCRCRTGRDRCVPPFSPHARAKACPGRLVRLPPRPPSAESACATCRSWAAGRAAAGAWRSPDFL